MARDLSERSRPLCRDDRRHVHQVNLARPAMDQVEADLLFIPAPAEVHITSGFRCGKGETIETVPCEPTVPRSYSAASMIAGYSYRPWCRSASRNRFSCSLWDETRSALSINYAAPVRKTRLFLRLISSSDKPSIKVPQCRGGVLGSPVNSKPSSFRRKLLPSRPP